MWLASFRVLAGLIPLIAAAQSKDSGSEARAILEKHCLACHGAAKMSGLDLRSRAAMIKGGSRGPALAAGAGLGSLPHPAPARTGELKMPPGKPRLAAAELAVLRQWIDAGAPWADAVEKGRPEPGWWSFRIPQKPSVPAVSEAAWVTNPIDAFVAATLESKGLH